MRKARIALFTAIVLLLTALLGACNSTSNAPLDKIIDPEVELTDTLYTNLSKIKSLTDYKIVDANEWLAVCMHISVKDGLTTYKILNLQNGEIVRTLEEKKTRDYDITLVRGVPTFAVAKTVTKKIESGADPDDAIEKTYYLYDINGDKVFSSTMHQPAFPVKFSDDTFIYNYVAYKIADNGEITEDAVIPEYLMPYEYLEVAAGGDYYALAYSGKTVFLNKSFEPVYTFLHPSNIYDGKTNMHVLNNGNLLFQYMVALPEDASSYDFYGAEGSTFEGKFEFHSLLINPKDGKETTLEIDGYVKEVMTEDEERSRDGNQLVEGFENIARIVPIIDKTFPSNYNHAYVAFLTNSGKLEKIELVEDQGINLPVMVAEDVYYLETRNGGAVILNAKGEVTKTLTNTELSYEGNYFIGSRAIYDTKMEQVFDLIGNDAYVIGAISDSVFVRQTTDDGYKVIMLRGGEQKTIYTYDEDDKADERAVFELYDEFGYSITDPDTDKINYYNAAGDLIDSVDTALEVYSNDDVIILLGEHEDDILYYTMTK